jgi:hypothetical protein
MTSTARTVEDAKLLNMSQIQLGSYICDKIYQLVSRRNGTAQPSDIVYALFKELLHINNVMLMQANEQFGQAYEAITPSAHMPLLTRRHLRSTLEAFGKNPYKSKIALVAHNHNHQVAPIMSDSMWLALLSLKSYILQGMVNAQSLYPNVREYLSYTLAPVVGALEEVQAWDVDPMRHSKIMLISNDFNTQFVDYLDIKVEDVNEFYNQLYALFILSYQLDSTDNESIVEYVFKALSLEQ